MSDKLGKFIIEHEIGRGGMGIVYKGKDPETGAPVAIKVLPAHLASDQTFLNRFRREASTLQNIEHQGVVKILDQGKDHDTWYYVMEFVDGETLDDRLKRSKLAPREAMEIALQVSKTLEEAHANGIIHRDLKPANIMLMLDGTAKLTDFGIAKLVDATRMTATDSILGTVDYMSPEQSQGRFVDPRTDIYSLGVVLYRSVTGKLPITGENPTEVLLKLRTQQIEKPINWRPDLQEYVSELIMRMLEKDPADRIPSARALTRELERALDRMDIEEKQADQPIGDRILASASDRKRALPVSPGILTAIAALAIILVGVAYLARSGDPTERMEKARQLADSPSSTDRSRAMSILESLVADEAGSEIGREAADLLESLRAETGAQAMGRQLLLAANFAERRGEPELAFDLLDLVVKYFSGTQQAEEASARMERMREILENADNKPSPLEDIEERND